MVCTLYYEGNRLGALIFIEDSSILGKFGKLICYYLEIWESWSFRGYPTASFCTRPRAITWSPNQTKQCYYISMGAIYISGTYLPCQFISSFSKTRNPRPWCVTAWSRQPPFFVWRRPFWIYWGRVKYINEALQLVNKPTQHKWTIPVPKLYFWRNPWWKNEWNTDDVINYAN